MGIIKLIVALIILTISIGVFFVSTEIITKFLKDYNEIIQLLTSLLLAYVTWQYAHASQLTLKFMKYSFEKEYEEDIKFMFININKNTFINQNYKREEEKIVDNESILKERVDFKDIYIEEKDDNILSVRVFNSGKRLISHIRIIYLVSLFDIKGEIYTKKEIEVIIAKTVNSNDYVTIPLVEINQLPKVEIEIKSLKSFNGMGKEQLNNSPQNTVIYYNKNANYIN